MLSFEDCISLCGLSEEEIAAIAAHERIPQLPAAELGAALLQQPDGVARLCAMILEDVTAAQSHGNWARSARLKLVLRQFLENHRPQPAVRSAGIATGARARSGNRAGRIRHA